jgi:hypothetical protein
LQHLLCLLRSAEQKLRANSFRRDVVAYASSKRSAEQYDQTGGSPWTVAKNPPGGSSGGFFEPGAAIRGIHPYPSAADFDISRRLTSGYPVQETNLLFSVTLVTTRSARLLCTPNARARWLFPGTRLEDHHKNAPFAVRSIICAGAPRKRPGRPRRRRYPSRDPPTVGVPVSSPCLRVRSVCAPATLELVGAARLLVSLPRAWQPGFGWNTLNLVELVRCAGQYDDPVGAPCGGAARRSRRRSGFFGLLQPQHHDIGCASRLIGQPAQPRCRFHERPARHPGFAAHHAAVNSARGV